MDVNTLRVMTTEVSGRTVDPTLAAHLPQYAVEMAALLQAIRTSTQEFPSELAPAAVFSLKAMQQTG